MKKVFYDIIVDVTNDIKLVFGVKEQDEDSDRVLQEVSLIAYKNDITNPLAETNIIIEPSEDERWTLYLPNDEMAEIKLLGMTAQITRDLAGNVFATIKSPDFDASFLVKDMTATDDVPF